MLHTDTLRHIIIWFLPVKMQAKQPTHGFAQDTFLFNSFQTFVFDYVSKYFKEAYKGFTVFWGTGPASLNFLG